MKYANNTFEDMTNCSSHILYVKGRLHISLFARRKIETGEELLFDYGYNEQKREEIEWLRNFTQKYLF